MSWVFLFRFETRKRVGRRRRRLLMITIQAFDDRLLGDFTSTYLIWSPPPTPSLLPSPHQSSCSDSDEEEEERRRRRLKASSQTNINYSAERKIIKKFLSMSNMTVDERTGDGYVRGNWPRVT